jgi:hypothetical protein
MKRARCLFFVASLASSAHAESRPRHALEVGLFGGHSWSLRVHTENEQRVWSKNGGEAFAAYALFRSPYFLSPYIDVGYYPLYASQEARDVGPPFGTLHSTSSMSTLAFVAGPAFDFWHLRLRAGMGAYRLQVRSTVLGETITPAELDGGYLFAVSGWFLVRSRVRVGLEGRLGLIVEADIPMAAVGVTIGGDALTW